MKEFGKKDVPSQSLLSAGDVVAPRKDQAIHPDH